MLKKVGIVLAASAAGLLMASPLAIAGNAHHKGHNEGEGEHNEFNGIPIANDDNVQVPIQACGDNVNVIAVQLQLLGPGPTTCNQAAAIFD